MTEQNERRIFVDHFVECSHRQRYVAGRRERANSVAKASRIRIYCLLDEGFAKRQKRIGYDR
jgi:hypothetical protein